MRLVLKRLKCNEKLKIDEDLSFHTKSVGARSAILFAGPLANFLFSFILFVFYKFMVWV